MTAVASGIANQSPGLEIVRRDPADAPFIYNTDDYTVIENLTGHPEYLTFVRRAGVQDSIELRSAIDLWVWILGPTRDRAVHYEQGDSWIHPRRKRESQRHGSHPLLRLRLRIVAHAELRTTKTTDTASRKRAGRVRRSAKWPSIRPLKAHDVYN